MLDFANCTGSGACAKTFGQHDPIQKTMRESLGKLSESELAMIESDIAYFSLVGIITDRLKSLIGATDAVRHA